MGTAQIIEGSEMDRTSTYFNISYWGVFNAFGLYNFCGIIKNKSHRSEVS
jgi:hypothetical protein